MILSIRLATCTYVCLSLSLPLNIPCSSCFFLYSAGLFFLPSFQAVEAPNRSDVASCAEGVLDVVALTTVQSAFRGHLARCSHATERWLMFTQKLFKRTDPVKCTVYFLQLCVFVCALALFLLYWETVCPHWYQEELDPHMHPAEQVRFTHTYFLWSILYFIYS